MVKKRKNPISPKFRDGFRISNGPLIHMADDEPLRDLAESAELPRFYGPPILFAIARDPRTIFASWNIDWQTVFAKTAPLDRQVHLRVYHHDGAQETGAAVEPMTGNCCLTVSQPGGAYRVEIGYYQPPEQWNRVATSQLVTMPPDSVSENAEINLATIPFHLSFQRLIDLFRASKPDALAQIVSRLQTRALTNEERDLLSAEESEILRAMNLFVDEIHSAHRSFLTSINEVLLRARTEALLGFGATSPWGAFRQSSW